MVTKRFLIFFSFGMDVFSLFSLSQSGGCLETMKQSISSHSEDFSLLSSSSGLLSLTLKQRENLIIFERYDTRWGKNESDFSCNNNLASHKSEDWHIIAINIPFLLLLRVGYMTDKSFHILWCKHTVSFHLKKNEMSETILKDFICLFSEEAPITHSTRSYWPYSLCRTGVPNTWDTDQYWSMAS